MMTNKPLLLLIFLGALIASLGTYPFAHNFSTTIFGDSNFAKFSAILFVITALTANIALSSYSLLNSFLLVKSMSKSKIIITLIVATFSATVSGFMSFVGYAHTLSLSINILMSVVIMIVNGAIAFNAITVSFNDSLHTSKRKLFKPSQNINVLKLMVFIICIACTFIVTFTAFLASSHGIASIIKHYDLLNKDTLKLTYFLSLIIWLSNAALFINSSRITADNIYKNITSGNIKISSATLLIIVTAIFSGSAYAQITFEYFSIDKLIPEFFKNIARHELLVYYFIMPVAFIISAAVNGYALTELRNKFK